MSFRFLYSIELEKHILKHRILYAIVLNINEYLSAQKKDTILVFIYHHFIGPCHLQMHRTEHEQFQNFKASVDDCGSRYFFIKVHYQT